MEKLYSIRIFCKNKIKDLKAWLNDFLEDRVFFDEDPKIVQLENKIEVHYQKGKSPVRISLHAEEDTYFEKEISQIKDILNISRNSKGKNLVTELINDVCNLMLLEFRRDEFEPDDDVWEFLDIFEAWTAKEFEGFIHTDDEVFYDKNLKKIYKL